MMTREEAIKAFEEIKANAQNKLGKKYAAGCEGYYQDKIDLADAVLTALRPVSREQVEKMRGEWIFPTVVNGRSFNIPHCSICGGVPCGTDENTKFCANCGAPMTDEAVEMVMERMEELHENIHND